MNKKSKKWVIIIIIAAVVVFIAVAAVVAMTIVRKVSDDVLVDGTKIIRGDINEGEDYKDSCKTVSYSELAANPKEYAGEQLVYTGEIHVLKDGGSTQTLIVDTKASDTADIYSGDTLMVTYSGDAPIYNYARVNIYGEATGDTASYEDSLYNEDALPVIEAQYIEILEGSRD